MAASQTQTAQRAPPTPTPTQQYYAYYFPTLGPFISYSSLLLTLSLLSASLYDCPYTVLLLPSKVTTSRSTILIRVSERSLQPPTPTDNTPTLPHLPRFTPFSPSSYRVFFLFLHFPSPFRTRVSHGLEHCHCATSVSSPTSQNAAASVSLGFLYLLLHCTRTSHLPLHLYLHDLQVASVTHFYSFTFPLPSWYIHDILNNSERDPEKEHLFTVLLVPLRYRSHDTYKP